ncbi:hypothetical protein K8T06_01390 [bacterium]|nr:hypothetical protein [bacterium]
MRFHSIQGEFTDLKGPEGGDISSLHWCPNTPSRLWCGSASGGLYCRDLKTHVWKNVEPPFRPMIKIESLETAIGARQNLLVLSQQGDLALSKNQGETWTNNFPALKNETIRVLRHHPLHPGLVFAGTQSGLFTSPDSGLTWSRFFDRVSRNTITAIAFHTKDPLTFFVADTNGFSARVLMTVNGGYSFDILIEGEEYFNQIHTLHYLEEAQTLWVAGAGYGWRVARAQIHDSITWDPVDHGLPVSSITCMAVTSDNRIIIGSNGGGIYEYQDSRETWRRLDIEPRRRYVRCMAASTSGLAAGFSENGVTIEINGEWIDSNEELYTRNISRIQRSGHELIVVSDGQLFIRSTNKKWKPLTGFQLVQDVLSHDSICYTSGLYSGIFRRMPPNNFWENLDLPVSRAILVRTTSTGKLHVLTNVKHDRIRFYAFEPEALNTAARWNDCSQDLPISSIVQDFAVDEADDTLFITVATSRAVYCYDSFTDSWMPSQLPENYRITCLYRSRLSPDLLYAAAGKYLLKSLDFGRSFENEPVYEFPSKISSLTLSGLGFETIWISTENGGIYVSHLQNCWNSLFADETALPINQIAIDTKQQGVMYCGTRGISCWKLAIPSVNLRMKQNNPNQDGKLFLTLHNPTLDMEVEIHFLRVLQARKPIEYLILENGVFMPSLSPKPLRIRFKGKSEYPEIFIGTVPVELLIRNATPAIAVCVPGKFHPVCDIQIAQLITE